MAVAIAFSALTSPSAVDVLVTAGSVLITTVITVPNLQMAHAISDQLLDEGTGIFSSPDRLTSAFTTANSTFSIIVRNITAAPHAQVRFTPPEATMQPPSSPLTLGLSQAAGLTQTAEVVAAEVAVGTIVLLLLVGCAIFIGGQIGVCICMQKARQPRGLKMLETEGPPQITFDGDHSDLKEGQLLPRMLAQQSQSTYLVHKDEPPAMMAQI